MKWHKFVNYNKLKILKCVKQNFTGSFSTYTPYDKPCTSLLETRLALCLSLMIPSSTLPTQDSSKLLHFVQCSMQQNKLVCNSAEYVVDRIVQQSFYMNAAERSNSPYSFLRYLRQNLHRTLLKIRIYLLSYSPAIDNSWVQIRPPCYHQQNLLKWKLQILMFP